MQLTRWDPWSSDLFDLFRQGSDAPKSGFVPTLDVLNRENEYVVDVDLPGLSPEEVDVSVRAGVLTIKGERLEKSTEEGENWLRRETRLGRFERNLSLPKDANADEVRAAFDDGVLTVTIPKQEKAQPRKIEIQPSS